MSGNDWDDARFLAFDLTRQSAVARSRVDGLVQRGLLCGLMVRVARQPPHAFEVRVLGRHRPIRSSRTSHPAPQYLDQSQLFLPDRRTLANLPVSCTTG
jgi:hypothetical protein